MKSARPAAALLALVAALNGARADDAAGDAKIFCLECYGGGPPGPPIVLGRRGASGLIRAEGAPSAAARGRLAYVNRRDRDKLRGKVRGLEPSATYDFLKESHGQSDAGAMRTSVSFTTDSRGRGAFETVAYRDYAGDRVEVRDAAGRTVLLGSAPGGRVRPMRVSTSVGSYGLDSRVKGRLRLDVRPRSGFERMRIAASGFASPHGTPVVLRVMVRVPPVDAYSAATYRYATAGTATIDRRGRVEFVFDTRTGDPLPDGVASLTGYDGAIFYLLIDGATVGETGFDLPQ